MTRLLAACLTLFVPGPAAADPSALAWADRCRAAATTPQDEGACAEAALRLVCAYAPAPMDCRDAVTAQVLGRALAQLGGLPGAPRLADLPGWTAPADCRTPPPPLTTAACEGRVLGQIVTLAAMAQAAG